MKVAIIDGQGGGLGKSIIDRIAKINDHRFEIIALGTNSTATTAMIRAGANTGATGENAIMVNASKVDIIMGPIAIVIPNSIMGEISPKMAIAIGSSDALKILIPLNRCNVEIPGTKHLNINELLNYAVDELLRYYDTKKG